jgi:hypothetical protein
VLAEISGLGREMAALLAWFPERLAQIGQGTALEIPPSFAEMLAAALALEGVAPEPAALPGAGAVLVQHYLEFLPSLRVAQLTRTGPPEQVLHRELRWADMPALQEALSRLAGLLGAVPGGATLNEIYCGAYYGRYLPLLYGFPQDLQRLQDLIDQGGAPEAVIQEHLGAALVHELSHGRRQRQALSPPYIDECVASYVGVQALPALAFPDGGPIRALYGAPWLCQVGQALARAMGRERLLAAHRDEAPLPGGLARALVRLGWAEYVARRAPHFLSSNLRPGPWMKLSFLAAAGQPLDGLTLEALEARPWSDIPAGAEDPMDAEILDYGLRAMCLRNVRAQGTFFVEPALPASAVRIDLRACTVQAADSLTAEPLSYLFPPATAARLRERGLEEYVLEVRDLAALPEIAAAVMDGARSQSGSGYVLTTSP